MKIIVCRYRRTLDEGRPDYNFPILTTIEGETAKECMESLRMLRQENDIIRCTPYEIINVLD